MSAGRFGPVSLDETDGQPGHYYVSVRDEKGRYALALGPFTARGPLGDRGAHLRALGYVARVKRYVNEHGGPREQWLAFGTCRLPLASAPPRGRLNRELGLAW